MQSKSVEILKSNLKIFLFKLAFQLWYTQLIFTRRTFVICYFSMLILLLSAVMFYYLLSFDPFLVSYVLYIFIFIILLTVQTIEQILFGTELYKK